MEYVVVQGVHVPRLGLGTWQLNGRRCRESVRAALDLGYRHIDTAEMYRNEDEIGAAIRDSGVDREELYLVSKVWHDNLRRDDTLRACQASLRRLETDYLDLYLIHWPYPRVPVEETVEALEELKAGGKIRQYGVSNFSVSETERARAAARTGVFCNQVEYHPFHRQDELLEYCQANDVLLTAYTPLAKGRVARDRTLREIGRRRDKTGAQAALRWLLQQDKVVVIPKAASRKHLEENLAIFDFELSAAEMAEIDSLG